VEAWADTWKILGRHHHAGILRPVIEKVIEYVGVGEAKKMLLEKNDFGFGFKPFISTAKLKKSLQKYRRAFESFGGTV
jgi:hypothetical protein